MNPEEQRIAIAEACGYSQIENLHTMKFGGSWVGYPPVNPIIGSKIYLPDYLNDLNAMFEAEKVLNAQQQMAYSSLLHTEMKGRHYLHVDFDMLYATASQRAEAFLKTIGKWKD